MNKSIIEPPIGYPVGFPFRLFSRHFHAPDRPPLQGCLFIVHGRTDRQLL